jgi:hypothetical protein
MFIKLSLKVGPDKTVSLQTQVTFRTLSHRLPLDLPVSQFEKLNVAEENIRVSWTSLP